MNIPLTKRAKLRKRREEMGLVPAWSEEIEDYLEAFTEKEALMLLLFLEAAAGREKVIPEAKKGVQATAYRAKNRVLEDVKLGYNIPLELKYAVMSVAPRVIPQGLLFAVKNFKGSGWENRRLIAVERGVQPGIPATATTAPSPIPQTFVQAPPPVPQATYPTFPVSPLAKPIPEKMLKEMIGSGIDPRPKTVEEIEAISNSPETAEMFEAVERAFSDASQAAGGRTGTPMDWLNRMKSRVDMSPDPSTLTSPRPNAMDALKPADEEQGWEAGLKGTGFEELKEGE